MKVSIALITLCCTLIAHVSAQTNDMSGHLARLQLAQQLQQQALSPASNPSNGTGPYPRLDGRSLTIQEMLNFNFPSDADLPTPDELSARAQAALRYAARPTAFSSQGPDYTYGLLLNLSFMFYEAQRSGKLPSDNRIDWRGNSALYDGDDIGHDLTGGYYDAGDHLKLHFPLGSSLTVLAWGVLEFKQGYNDAGQYGYAQAALQWGADYIMKCNLGSSKVVAQVGTAGTDHAYWGRPEDMTKQNMPRPATVLATQSQPASDMLAEFAAALASISMVVGGDQGNKYLDTAKTFYTLATKNEGRYSQWVGGDTYPSSSYLDDLSFAACWMYKATGDQSYLNDAVTYWQRNYNEEGSAAYKAFAWDSVIYGASVLLSQLKPKDTKYAVAIETSFLPAWMNGLDGVTYTPKHLAYISPWGSLRMVMNAAFISVVYANGIRNSDPAKAQGYECWAMSQVRYALGDAGHSFVVGYGWNPPTHEHHRAASCPWPNQGKCDWSTYSGSQPDAHVLYGALVGGPDANDGWSDVRSDFQRNEVALDYNAGYTGVLAAFASSSSVKWSECGNRGGGGGSSSPPPPSTPSPPPPSTPTPSSTPAPIPSRTPSPTSSGGGGGSKTGLDAWAQCGGRGGTCTQYACADAAFPNTYCKSGASCTRQSEWYWQCVG